jgi:hypothetical protein
MNMDSVHRYKFFLARIPLDNSEKPELNCLKRGHVSVGHQDHDGSLTKTVGNGNKSNTQCLSRNCAAETCGASRN